MNKNFTLLYEYHGTATDYSWTDAIYWLPIGWAMGASDTLINNMVPSRGNVVRNMPCIGNLSTMLMPIPPLCIANIMVQYFACILVDYINYDRSNWGMFIGRHWISQLADDWSHIPVELHDIGHTCIRERYQSTRRCWSCIKRRADLDMFCLLMVERNRIAI